MKVILIISLILNIIFISTAIAIFFKIKNLRKHEKEIEDMLNMADLEFWRSDEQWKL